MNSNPNNNGTVHKESERTSIQKSVLEKIQHHEVRMRPRIFFILKIIGIAVLTFFVLTFSILICNFIFFTLRLNGHDTLLSFGGPGILLFFRFFPWHLLVLDLIAIFWLWFLVRQFKFGYRSPWLYALIALLLISIIGGALLDRGTPLNDALLHQADIGHLPPPLRDLYRGTRQPPPPGSGEFRGVITAISAANGGSLILSSYQQATTTTITVMLPQNGPDAGEHFRVGNLVEVVGQLQGGVVHAFGIHPLDDPNGLPPH